MHRVIMNARPEQEIDHRNHNGLDNQKVNLRVCNDLQNAENRQTPRNNTSGFKGVWWHKQARKWRAAVRFKGECFSCGLFDDPARAAHAYNEAARKIFGEFAHQNTIIRH